MDSGPEGGDIGRILSCVKVVINRLFDHIPIVSKDSVVIGENTTTNSVNIVDDLRAIISRLGNIDSNHFLTAADKCRNLRHVCLVNDVQSIGHFVSRSALSQWSGVGISD